MISVKNLFKQVYACLFNLRAILFENVSLLVIFILACNTYGYAIFYFRYTLPMYTGKPVADWYEGFHEQGLMLANGSFLFLALMFSVSHKFNLPAKIAFLGLCLKWFLSEIYIVFNLGTGFYTASIMLAIYCVALVFSLAKITRRI